MGVKMTEVLGHTATHDLAPMVRPRTLGRVVLGGVLMGLANLVPGVSGGTMILVVGLYDDVVSSVADLTRLKFSRRALFLVLTIAGCAFACIVLLAKSVLALVTAYPAAMYSLFIGLTLGGVPLLNRMVRPLNASAVLMIILGLGAMTAVAVTRTPKPNRAHIQAEIAGGTLQIQPQYTLDLIGGAMAAAAMVLPGISGSYVLLVIDRYETALAAIDATKAYLLSGGRQGDALGLHVLIPLAAGTLAGLVTMTNLLRWLLRRHAKPTLGLLLGILLGSVVGLWRFDAESTLSDYAGGLALAALGFVATFVLSRYTSPAPGR